MVIGNVMPIGAGIYTKHADTWCESGYSNYIEFHYLAEDNVEEHLTLEECKGACDDIDQCEAFGYNRDNFLCVFYESCVFEENSAVDTYVRSSNGKAVYTYAYVISDKYDLPNLLK